MHVHSEVPVYGGVTECMFFFPWLKPPCPSAGSQNSSLIWHVSHSQFPPLMHDSCALCSTRDCEGEMMTTSSLSDCPSPALLKLLLLLIKLTCLSICRLLPCFPLPPVWLSDCKSLSLLLITNSQMRELLTFSLHIKNI